MRLEAVAPEQSRSGGPDVKLRARRPRFTVRFSVSMLILMALILLPLSSTLLWLGWRAVDAQEQRSVDLRMNTLYNAISDFIGDGVRVDIAAAEALAETSDFSMSSGGARDEVRRRTLMALLTRHSNLAAAFAGYPDGHLVYVGRVSFLSNRERQVFGAPKDAVFLFRVVEGQGTDRRQSWWFDAVQMPRDGVQTRPTDFDPRQRPWYIEAMRRQGAALTDPYRFAWSAGGLGVSAGVPIDGGGVIGFDFNLGTLSQLLNEYKITPNSIIGLATDVADLVIESTPCQPESPGCLSNDGDVRQVLRTMAQQATGDHYRAERTLEMNGHDYRFIVQAASPVYGKSMMVAAAVPLAELSAASRILLVRAAIAAAVTVIVAIVAVLGVSLFLARSMARLAAKTERIRELDFSDRIPVESRITEISRLSQAVERMRSGLEVFGLYVSKQLVGEIMRSPGSTGLGGTRRQLTVMFTDIEGFSRISESIEPELLTSRLSRYFDTLGGAIAANHGMIDKYIGDGVMAFWNAPQPDSDHVVHACAAALEVARSSRRLAQKWRKLGRPPFNTRVGLHTGQAVVGNVGARQRINYTLVGAVANQASRLENLNKAYGTEILASGDVATAAATQFVWRPVDRIVAAGTTEVLDIHELVADIGQAKRFAPFLEKWRVARDAYIAGRFADAKRDFESALALKEGDGPCIAFISRCGQLSDAGPLVGWDGVWRFEQK
ncbi:adenylate cyclase [Enhydrobacter aerosaccus]|uniref:Adenylate cyclase n=2 Tax=Enhydrobacter aerosaccus TaxID=225324 RepID=A0A1T4L969_9HYPH|nr:adenylate cyclase [Enhydrobacter aerosaccus]